MPDDDEVKRPKRATAGNKPAGRASPPLARSSGAASSKSAGKKAAAPKTVAASAKALGKQVAAAPPRVDMPQLPPVLYAYPHVAKTGGTSLSVVLMHLTSPLCGSRAFDSFCSQCRECPNSWVSMSEPERVTKHTLNPFTLIRDHAAIASCRRVYESLATAALTDVQVHQDGEARSDVERSLIARGACEFVATGPRNLTQFRRWSGVTALPPAVRAPVASVYAHAGVSYFEAVFQDVARRGGLRYLVLVRSVLPHRLSWFREIKGSVGPYRQEQGGGRANFSGWIASALYRRNECGLQIKVCVCGTVSTWLGLAAWLDWLGVRVRPCCATCCPLEYSVCR